MDSPPVPVLHADRILSAFGYWPSFHDAEVHRAELDRGVWPILPSVTLVIHTFDSDGTVDEKGYYRIRTSVLVTLRFDAVDDLELRDLGRQNVVSVLMLEPQRDGRIAVELGQSFGLAGVFSCGQIEVCDVRPWPSPTEDAPPVRPT
jgi:hypothetical protein